MTYPFKLSDANVGSYVKYTGNNGCSGTACAGGNVSTSYTTSGWRIAYSKDETAYLTSAGSPEVMCTSSDGTAGTSCASSESKAGVPQHRANLNAKALTYCNSVYAYDGICNSNSAWNMNYVDFNQITGISISTGTESSISNSVARTLISNGGSYWFDVGSGNPAGCYFWSSENLSTSINYTSSSYGIRPVLRLRSSVKVISGLGTYADPYVIE